MPKTYIVDKAFLSTVSKEDKSPQIVQTRGGDMHKYMVQVQDQPFTGWFQILKKPGNAVSAGEELYGDFVENNWGKMEFKRAQKPYDPSSPQAPRPSQAAQVATGGSLEAKVDYLISMVENFLGAKKAASQGKDVVIEDITDDDGPVDLSELDY